MGGLNSKLSIDRRTKSTPFKNLNDLESDDPRSPNIFFRTPISKVSPSKTTKRSYDMCPRNLLKSKLQDAVDNNMVDPRSPSSFIVRTPICLKNSLSKTSDKIEDGVVVNQLDDNVADGDHADVSIADDDAAIADIENASDISAVTEISTIDPRSPSLNIDRTPFFFTNNKAINVNDNADNTDKDITITDAIINTATDDEKLQKLAKMMIFEDDNENNYSTPPKKICEKKSLLITADGENKQPQQRTPLSCLGNRKNSKFSMRNNFDDSALKSFSGFAKGNNLFSSSRAEHSDEVVNGINDFNKEKVF